MMSMNVSCTDNDIVNQHKSTQEFFDREEIQMKFLRAGPYTHLHIKHDPHSSSVEWVFTFADMGMCHTIQSTSSVEIYDENTIYVDNVPHNSKESALVAVFGNHYRRFIAELYQNMGIDILN